MNTNFLYDMLCTPSVSGDEFVLQSKVKKYMEASVEVESDAIGNVYSYMGDSKNVDVLMCGHIDEIGLMVVNFSGDGMVKVIKSGGIRVATYFGQKVRILTENGVVYGAVGINSSLLKNKEACAEDLWIDIGATSKEEAMKVVKHGDYVVLDTEYHELLNDCITARAMDDRIGAFIVLEALLKAKEMGAKVSACATTTVGEESSMRGAYFAASHVKPKCAIAVDVTFASDAPGVADEVYGDIKVNGGPVLCHSSIVNRKLNERLVHAADTLGMSIQWEGAAGRTGTDADVMLKTNDGTPVALVSIPLRYMHSPSEVGSKRDIQACIDLLAQFLVEWDSDICLKPVI
ncbi:MAG: M20/M25/M40 family metallo-hydrolase [Erysipelotrichales bacterium]|nr:M20/M25/M40 family metallo-hydrolase [Erysipelotrichales bacterium]